MDIGIIIDKLSRHHSAHAWLRYNYVNNKIIIIIILYISIYNNNNNNYYYYYITTGYVIMYFVLSQTSLHDISL